MKTPFEKARRLRQTQETWACAQPLARTWITSRNQAPYRPFLLLVISPGGKILLQEPQKSEVDTDQVLDYLLRAMTRPLWGSGRSRRPQTIYFDNEEYVAALSEPLAALDIDCKYRVSLPTLDSVRQFLEKGMGSGGGYPGLLSIPDVMPPLVGHIFELAADYHEAKPWRCLNDHTPLEISYPPEAPPRYAVVMGSGGEIFGLSIYDSIEKLRLMFRQDLSSAQLMKRASWQVLYFEPAMAMSFDDLDAITQFNWPVANETAYPVLGRTKPPRDIGLPSKADLLWLEGALEAILAYLPQAQKYSLTYPKPVDLELTVHPIGGKAKLRLQTPRLDDLLDRVDD